MMECVKPAVAAFFCSILSGEVQFAVTFS